MYYISNFLDKYMTNNTSWAGGLESMSDTEEPRWQALFARMVPVSQPLTHLKWQILKMLRNDVNINNRESVSSWGGFILNKHI